LNAARGGFRRFVDSWNKLQGLTTPALHGEIIAWLESSWRAGDRQLLLMVFRDAGKSTLLGLFAAWLLVKNPDLRILVLAADGALARKMVRNVRRVVERHPAAEKLRPTKVEQWAADQFTVCRRKDWRDPSMMAKGIEANLTGCRAEVVLCDDVEVPNTSDTSAKRKELRQRLSEIEYVLVPDGTQVYAGTPHAFDTIYAVGRGAAGPGYLHGFKALRLPLLDERGGSRWPERFTVERIAVIRERTGPAKFHSQMQLEPMATTDIRLDPAKLVPYADGLRHEVGNGGAQLSIGARRMVGASCHWDPAFGRPERGDASVVAAVFQDDGGNYWLHRVDYLTVDVALLDRVDAATQQCERVARLVAELQLPSVTIETNGIGGFLPGLLRSALSRWGIGCAVAERPNLHNKESRILAALDGALEARRIRAHELVLAGPLAAEMRDWRPDGKSRDDGLDAVAGAILSLPSRRSPAVPGQRPAWPRGAGARLATTQFDPLT